MSKKYDLLTFEDFFMNFLLELKFLILSHPVTSKQPHKIVQILLVHPVIVMFSTWNSLLVKNLNSFPIYLQGVSYVSERFQEAV